MRIVSIAINGVFGTIIAIAELIAMIIASLIMKLELFIASKFCKKETETNASFGAFEVLAKMFGWIMKGWLWRIVVAIDGRTDEAEKDYGKAIEALKSSIDDTFDAPTAELFKSALD